MPTHVIPENTLNALKVGAILVQENEHNLNHQIVFVNDKFIEEIGYSVNDIPNKNAWWKTAYPDELYQKVVARQWELAVETYEENEGEYIVMDAEIHTKYHGYAKFRVYSEAVDHLLDGYYVVMFEKLNQKFQSKEC